MTALLTLLASDTGRRVLLALAVLLAVLSAAWWLRRDAASDARTETRAEALEQQETSRAQGDAAARDAERAGAERLLDAGRF